MVFKKKIPKKKLQNSPSSNSKAAVGTVTAGKHDGQGAGLVELAFTLMSEYL